MPKLALRASGIERRRTELGWRAAVLDERESRHAFRLRATTTAADSKRDARAAPKLDVENAVVSILQCAMDAASLDVTEVVW